MPEDYLRKQTPMLVYGSEDHLYQVPRVQWTCKVNGFLLECLGILCLSENIKVSIEGGTFKKLDNYYR